MKKQLIQLVILIFAATFLIPSCKKDDNNVSIPFISPSGTWIVSYYNESNDDHTSNFDGYSFTFSSTGTMTATNSAGTTTGTWSDDDDDNNNELHFSLGNTDPLKDLSKGWLVISQSSTEIVLKDDDSAHNEELHFTKI